MAFRTPTAIFSLTNEQQIKDIQAQHNQTNFSIFHR